VWLRLPRRLPRKLNAGATEAVDNRHSLFYRRGGMSYIRLHRQTIRESRMAKSARTQKRPPLRDARINIRLSGELHTKLVELSQKENRSLSSYIERILDRHVTEIKRR